MQQNDEQSFEESSMNDLKKHASNWSAQFGLDNKIVTEEDGLQAKTYFKKRNPTVINCLRALVSQVNCLPIKHRANINQD